MNEQQNLLNSDLQIDMSISRHLKETAGWARFLGIFGIVMSVLVIVLGIAAPTSMMRLGSMGRGMSSYESQMMDTMAGVMIVMFIIAGLIMLMVSLFAYRFGTGVKTALNTNDQVSLDKGVKNLKFLFRFYGIIVLIYVVFLVLALLLGGLGAMMGGY